MSYERISLSLISACSALGGAAIGALAVTWMERRKYKQIYRAKILSLLEEALENYARAIDYSLTAGKIELPQIFAYYGKIFEFREKYPLLPIQIKVIDKKLHKCLKELLSFHIKRAMAELREKEVKADAKQWQNSLEKCCQRIYEVWTE